MATYIKGADTYLPDIKPFTPDYKFLSAVLETRTDKYDANFKATNDVYNRVVYADMSRQDNIEKRDQFAENIAPQIEKISGMDLSLQQNASAAQGVFKPFWDDNLIVKDVVYTSKYRDEMAYANRLRDSPDRKLNDQFWDVGMRDMQYRMNDFINSDGNKALQMQLPRFVEDVDLVQLSQEILGEMDPPLKMKKDRFAQNGDLIITEQNGRLIAGQALEYLQATLQNNPKVQAAYKADAFVKSRDFAAAAMQAGRYQTVEEGQGAWAEETIRRIDARNKIDLDKKQVEGAQLEATNVSWGNYQAINGVVPGSNVEAVIKEKQSAAQETQAAIERMKGISHTIQSPTKSIDGNLNKAYSLLMQQNIGRDMRQGAMTFASRDMTYEITESQRGLKKLQHGYNVQLAAYKSALKREEIDYENTKSESSNALADAAGGGGVLQTYTDPNTIGVTTNEKGEVKDNVDILRKVAGEIVEVDNSLAEKQTEMMFRALEVSYPKGNSVYTQADANDANIPAGKKIGDVKSDFQFTIPFPTAEDPTATATGSEEQLKKRLLERNESGSGFINRDIINQAYAKISTEFGDSETLFKNHPNMVKDSYSQVYEKMFGENSIKNQQAFLDAGVKRTYEAVRETYKTTIKIAADDGLNFKLLADAGFPEIIGEDNIPMTEAEYIERVVSGVKDGSITNPDLWGWDTNKNKNYMMHAFDMVTEWRGNTKGEVKKYRYNKDGSKEMVLDEWSIADEAKTMYGKVTFALNKGLSGGYSNKGALPSAGFFATIDGRAGDFATVNQNASYTVAYNPLAPNAEANAITTEFVEQINALKESGMGFGIIAGDIDDVKDKDLYERQAFAERIYNLWLEDVQSWESNPKRSNSDAIAPVARITHKPTYGQVGDMEKNNAAYTISYSPEWLASKVKGGNAANIDGQYGAISTADMAKLGGQNNTTTFIFNSSEDQSVRSQNNRYYSTVQSEILLARDQRGGVGDYIDYTIPGPGIDVAAKYSINQAGGTYKAVGTEYIYQSYNEETKTGGTYITRTVALPFDMKYGLRGVDRQALALRATLQQTAASNATLQAADELKYGINVAPPTSLQNNR